MVKTFTPEDMIRYLYNEMNAEETMALEKALESDWTLREKFNVLKAAKDSLNTIRYSPRSQSVAAIMRHAGAHTGKKTIGQE
ncbi:MAG: hypothetical protein SFU87_04340 [Chitinophagaceae bacterium]|nr:hypothetical protein [Chitinophagaceae bacterium]